MRIRKTAIIGVGLIGASFALALRHNGICTEIDGSGRTEDNLLRAREAGIIDHYFMDHARACKDADLVVLATPVGCFEGIMSEIRDVLKKGTIITDVGSTKGEIVEILEREIPEGVSFVGAHPIAGSDRSGIETASADLFNDAICIITPTESSRHESLKTIGELWKQIGARVIMMPPDEHDRIFSSVSHVPHITAYAIIKTLSDINPSYINMSGQGFRDTTRIAMSSPEMWIDVCRSNRKNIMEHLDILIKNLESIKRLIENNDYDQLRSLLNDAKELRESIE